jgi:hypothetical protein
MQTTEPQIMATNKPKRGRGRPPNPFTKAELKTKRDAIVLPDIGYGSVNGGSVRLRAIADQERKRLKAERDRLKHEAPLTPHAKAAVRRHLPHAFSHFYRPGTKHQKGLISEPQMLAHLESEGITPADLVDAFLDKPLKKPRKPRTPAQLETHRLQMWRARHKTPQV